MDNRNIKTSQAMQKTCEEEIIAPKKNKRTVKLLEDVAKFITDEDSCNHSKKGGNTYLYYYKHSGKNIPLMYFSSENTVGIFEFLTSLKIKKDFLEQVEKDFPMTKNNLYIAVDGIEYFINKTN